jgi:hypothetical protein
MNPNSAHQLWSKWIITVRANTPYTPAYAEMRQNVGRFLRKGFGSAGQWRLRWFPRNNVWVVQMLAESARHPHSKQDFDYFKDAFVAFFRNGLGQQAHVHIKARLMAGERLDGRPSDQMLIMPSLRDLIASELAKEREANGKRTL